jgi:hypothetical protein
MEACLGRMEAEQEELQASHEKIEAVAEPCNWAPHIRAANFLTAPQGEVSEVLQYLKK